MAKRKDLLLTEATTMRMMGLAGIGSLANPFLKENYGDLEERECKTCGGKMKDGACESCSSMKEGAGEELEEAYDEGEDSLYEGEEELEEGEEELDEGEEELDEGGLVRHIGGSGDRRQTPSQMRKFGNVKNKKSDSSREKDDSKSSDKKIKESMRRLKRMLEEAEEMPAPEAGGAASSPETPPTPDSEDPTESKIKEFVKKLGDLIQETLGVQVTVEEGGDEEKTEASAMSPAGGAEASPPPAPMAEAINRLVNKVARRVKARLMEAKKKESGNKQPSKKELRGLEKHYGPDARAGIRGKHSHKSRMKDLEKEGQSAAKKKKMEMMRKKAAKKR